MPTANSSDFAVLVPRAHGRPLNAVPDLKKPAVRRACLRQRSTALQKEVRKSLPLEVIPPHAGEMSAKQTKGGRLRQEKVDWPKAKTDEGEASPVLPLPVGRLKPSP